MGKVREIKNSTAIGQTFSSKLFFKMSVVYLIKTFQTLQLSTGTKHKDFITSKSKVTGNSERNYSELVKIESQRHNSSEVEVVWCRVCFSSRGERERETHAPVTAKRLVLS